MVRVGAGEQAGDGGGDEGREPFIGLRGLGWVGCHSVMGGGVLNGVAKEGLAFDHQENERGDDTTQQQAAQDDHDNQSGGSFLWFGRVYHHIRLDKMVKPFERAPLADVDCLQNQIYYFLVNGSDVQLPHI